MYFKKCKIKESDWITNKNPNRSGLFKVKMKDFSIMQAAYFNMNNTWRNMKREKINIVAWTEIK